MLGARRAALLLAAASALTILHAAQAFSLFGGPTIDGEALSWDGDGDKFSPKKAFKDGDKYIKVTLTNWKMDATANLSLPATVKMLSLVNCRLESIPDEVRALTRLEKLNLASNRITTVDGTLASAGQLQSLNLTDNYIATYSLALPAVNTLDLSSNKLMAFPSAIFKSPLTTFAVNGNGFQLASVSQEQFDFFAGLGEFDADFAAITSCKVGTLVSLKGNKICRVESAGAAVNPTLAPNATKKANATKDSSMAGAAVVGGGGAAVVVTPAATVGVVVNPTTAGRSDSTYLLGGMIALLVGTVVGVGVFAIVTRRQTARLRGKLHEDTPLFFDSDKRTNYQRELDAGDKLFPSNDQVLVTWRVDYDSVKLVKKIAKGAFGEVWIGRYRGTKVAVKKLLGESQGSFEASEDFVREIKLMAWLQHPRIVEFIGVAWTKLVDMLAVIEFMDSGDLRSLLDADRSMTWQDRKLKYALDTIDAIVYLHSLSPVIIHRDLKSRNILVDSRKGAKLGDFGISAAKRDQDMTTGVGTTRWLAPELARGEILYTEAVDIYSFGVILAELDTNELPFFDARAKGTGEKLSDFAILQGVASGDLCVSFSATCPPKLLELARRCVSLDPKARPAASEVAYLLRQRDLLLA